MDISILSLGDNGIKIQFHDDVTPALNRAIQEFCIKLSNDPIHGVIEWVPAYDSIGIYYESHVITFKQISEQVRKLHVIKTQADTSTRRILHIPVAYGGEYGPDLKRVATHANYAEKEVIKQHQDHQCLVYMLGFLPGFPYLGGMTERIATPRLANPREKIHAGSVGIADKQTGIYPVASPGGWNIIGRTPVRLFDKEADEPFLFRAFDYVKFYAITPDEFSTIERKVKAKTYKIHIENEKEADRE